MSSISEIREAVDHLIAERRMAMRTLVAEKEELAKDIKALDVAKEAQGFLQGVAVALQESAHRQIADVVSRCLAAVFEEPYTVRIRFERKRGKTDALLEFERDGLVVDPMTAAGGGVVDVAAFVLRLIAIVTDPGRRRLLVLDEPFRFVAAVYRPQVRQLIEKLSHDMGVQIVMVTHIEELKTGKIVDLSSRTRGPREF